MSYLLRYLSLSLSQARFPYNRSFSDPLLHLNSRPLAVRTILFHGTAHQQSILELCCIHEALYRRRNSILSEELGSQEVLFHSGEHRARCTVPIILKVRALFQALEGTVSFSTHNKFLFRLAI